jgi:hypothetical protein
MVIMCEKCGIVYLIGATANNHIDCLPRSAGPGMFTLTCTACGAQRSFHKNDLKPYIVSAHGYGRGYAERGEYSARQDLGHNPSRKLGDDGGQSGTRNHCSDFVTHFRSFPSKVSRC